MSAPNDPKARRRAPKPNDRSRPDPAQAILDENRPFHAYTLEFLDREVASAYAMFQRRSLAHHVKRVALLIVLLSTAMSLWVAVLSHRDPTFRGAEADAVQALLWKLVIPTLVVGWGLARTPWFERVHGPYVWLSAVYISVGWLGVLRSQPVDLVLTLGPIMTVLVLYNLFTLSRMSVFACAPIGLGVVAGYVFVAAAAGAPERTLGALFGSLTGALVFAFIAGFLMERSRRLSFYAALVSEERRVQAERLAAELDAISRSDSLTGLANRRSFDENLVRAWARCARNREPLSVLVIDVDHFKSYNDLHGHTQGDKCLAEVAALLSRCANRADDLAARWGGEEFVLLLPGTDATGARKVAEALHHALRTATIVHGASDVSEQVTVSVGVATAQPGTKDASSFLLRAADMALYEAKRRGRDRTVVDGAELQTHSVTARLA